MRTRWKLAEMAQGDHVFPPVHNNVSPKSESTCKMNSTTVVLRRQPCNLCHISFGSNTIEVAKGKLMQLNVELDLFM